MKRNYVLMTLTLLVFFLLSCSKEQIVFDQENSNFLDKSVSTRSPKTGNSTVLETILGQQRNNPFKVSNMNQARINLYNNHNGLSTTHEYIKFSPTTQQHLALLDDWMFDEMIPVFDFPLDYEVIQMGERYIDPSISDSLFTYRYVSVPINTAMPNVPYIKLDDLFLDESDPLLIAESFILTNNHDEITEYVFKGGLKEEQLAYLGGNFPARFPPIIECPKAGCWPELVINVDNLPGSPFEWVCVCDGGGGDPEINECGCPIPTNPRKPAGCVQVENLPANFDAVEFAAIVARDNWFKAELKFTDNNGCWKADKLYAKRVWVWLTFVNNNVRVRDTRYWFGLRNLIDFVEKFDSPPYNNLLTKYASDETNNTSKGRQYWAAAHSLNVVNQYRDQAANDNIILPKTRLNWVNHGGEGGGAAPMLQGVTFSSWPSFLATLIAPQIFLPLVPMQPDIINQYDTLEPAFSLRSTGFHELGHASHYEIVGENYWTKYRNHIINNGGYGEFGMFANNSNEGHVALGEALGNFIGNRYGGSGAGGEFFEWDTGTNPDNFIPQGLMFDLGDNTPSDFVTDPNDITITGPDNISGFTPEMIFNALDGSSNSIRSFRDRLRTLHLGDTPNNATDYNNFVDLYDVFNN